MTTSIVRFLNIIVAALLAGTSFGIWAGFNPLGLSPSMLPTLQSTMHLYPIDGATHRVGKNDTPWSYRDANWAQIILGVSSDPADNQRIIAWSKGYWDAMHPYSAGGAYVNFMMDEGEDRVKATYRDSYARLLTIKNKYDPKNLFRVNQNIKPTV